MIQYKKLQLKNYVLFNNTKLKLNYTGLTVIGGVNKNAGGNDRSNGSGKSLLTSSIPTLWYGSSPSVVSAKSKARKDAFYRKDASLQIDFSIDGMEYSVRKFLSGKSIKYDIVKDGENMEFTTAQAAEAWLSTLSITEEQFYSTVYLDSRRPSLTMLSQGAQRFNFFSSLFSLDIYDQIKKRLEESYAGLKDQRIKLEFNEKEIARLNEEIESLDKNLDNRDEKWIQKRLASVKQVQEKRFLLTSLIKERSKIKSSDVVYDKEQHKKIKERVDRLTKEMVLYEEYVYWKDNHKATRERYDDIKEKISDLDMKNVDAETTQKKYWKVSASEEKRLKMIKEHDAIFQTVQTDKYDVKIYSKMKKKFEKVQRGYEWVTRQLELLKKSDVDSTECPVCDAPLGKDHIQRKIKKYKPVKKELRQEMDAIAQEMKNEKEKMDTISRMYKLKEEIPRDRSDQLEKLKDVMNRINKWNKLNAKLSEITIPAKPENAPAKNPRKELKEAKESLNQMENAKRYRDFEKKMAKNDVKDLDKEYDANNKKDIDAQYKLCSELEHWLKTRRESMDRKTELEAKAEKQRESLSKIKLVEDLITAYGNTGLKRLACAEIANRVETNLNNAAHLIFSEGFKFHMDVTATDFLMSFEDSRGVFDVRNLSGAESRSFTVLFMLALLPLLRSNLRCNLLIMDECDTNLDGVAIEKFRNNLVPALAKVIPHVIIVSPFADNYLEGRHFTVVKDGKTSRLRRI